ncbi:MAG: hypothetical protein SCK70_02690, partial [bacterium]|nr:hypothetical protein [bacterium]
MKRLISLSVLLLIAANIYAATLYTPNGKAFQTIDGNWPPYNSDWFERYKDNFGPGTQYPNSEVLGEWENGLWEYNCHVFAWNNWQGADRWNSANDMWKLGKPSPYNLMWRSSPDVWYEDYDNPIGIVSYITSASNEAAICTYSGNHSARIVGDGTRYISKWGYAAIVNHPQTEVPPSYGSVNAYYKINPAYRPVGNGDPAGRNWQTINNALNDITSGSLIAVLSGNSSLTGNAYIPSGVTLKIKSGATINFNGYYIASTGGTINIESGVTKNYVMLKSGSTLKGLFPSVQSAVNYSSSGQIIELLANTTYNGNVTISNKYNLDIIGQGYNSSYINGNVSITSSDYSDLSDLKTKNISTNNSWITINYVKGDKLTIYGDEVQINNSIFSSGQVPNQITNCDGTIYNCDITECLIGVYLLSNSLYNVGNNYFCQNDGDIYAYSGSTAFAMYNTYS